MMTEITKRDGTGNGHPRPLRAKGIRRCPKAEKPRVMDVPPQPFSTYNPPSIPLPSSLPLILAPPPLQPTTNSAGDLVLRGKIHIPQIMRNLQFQAKSIGSSPPRGTHVQRGGLAFFCLFVSALLYLLFLASLV